MYFIIYFIAKVHLQIIMSEACAVHGCRICTSYKHFMGEQQGCGKRGEKWHYVLFIGCGVLKKPEGCKCGLIKQIPNYPPLGPKTRSDPLLLALFTIHKSDDVEIVTGVSPELMTFEVEDNGAEYWPDRWNKHQ